jgi:membrane-associated phospholipid phosphatase
MFKKIFISLFYSFMSLAGICQYRDSSIMQKSLPLKPLTLDLKIDVPLTAFTTVWTLYQFGQTSKHQTSSVEAVTSLKISDINWFDRWAVLPYNQSADKLSYLPFYGAIAYPIVFIMLDRKMRKDILELSFLYLESMTITGAIYGSATNYAPRYRPFVYTESTSLDKRISPESRKAFFAGHVALVATSTFFMAGVFAKYHPDSKFKWLMYTIAAAATATTGYLRHEAGEHFPSDILVGTAVGTLSGLLVPALHKTKIAANNHLSFLPFAGEKNGMTFLYKF